MTGSDIFFVFGFAAFSGALVIMQGKKFRWEQDYEFNLIFEAAYFVGIYFPISWVLQWHGVGNYYEAAGMVVFVSVMAPRLFLFVWMTFDLSTDLTVSSAEGIKHGKRLLEDLARERALARRAHISSKPMPPTHLDSIVDNARSPTKSKPYKPPPPPTNRWPDELTNFATVSSSVDTYNGGTPTDLAFRLQTLYADMNRALFGGRLEPVAMKIEELQDKLSAVGLAHPNATGAHPELVLIGSELKPMHPGDRYLQISLDYKYIIKTPFQKVLSTVAHEMAHISQFNALKQGDPDAQGSHPPHWVSVMYEIGLIPTSTGKPGGEQSGDRVADYIEKGGLFDRVSREIIAEWAVGSNLTDEDFD